MGSILEVEIESKSGGGSKSVAAPAYIDPCKDRDVCRFDCKNLPGLSSCTKTAYFVDYTKYATGSSSQISTTYIDVCIKRITPGETNFFGEILKKYAYGSSKQQRVDNMKWQDLNYRLTQYFNSGSQNHVYVASMVEVLLGFQKLCSHSPSKFKKFKKKSMDKFDF
jgi:hypothetical protein